MDRRWIAAIAVGALVAGLVALLVERGALQPASAPPAGGALVVGSGDAAAPSAAPAEPAAASRPGAEPAPRIAAAAPPGCPEDEPDPPGLTRPSVWELLRLLNQELNDRLRLLGPDASPELREGVRRIAREGDMDEGLSRLRGAPDRRQDGFDFAVAGLLHVAGWAHGHGDLDAADAYAARAVEEAPTDATAWALGALVASERGAVRTAYERSARAFALAPDEPAVALRHSIDAASAAEFTAAVDAADAYLDAAPDDRRIAAWRARMAERAAMTETHARRTWSGIEIRWPDRHPRARPLDDVMEAVDAAMRETGALMGRARRPELSVVVYADADALHRATCTPDWSGAVFDGALHVDMERLSRPGWTRTVRHEATHAQLRLVRGQIPYWLNEGLAQWMEGDFHQGDRRRLARLAERGIWIPFESLEGPFLVIEDRSDARFAYVQSWAMVMWLVEREGEGAIRDALALVQRGESNDLLTRLSPDAEGSALLAFVGQLSRRPDSP